MKKVSALLIAGVMATALLNAPVRAEEDETLSTTTKATTEETITETTVEPGPFTTKYPVASQVVTFPLRAVTSGITGTVGFIGGTFRGIGTGVEESVGYAGEFGPEGDSMGSRGTRGLLYVPAAAGSSLYYVPRNVVVGGSKNAYDFGKSGYKWWDRL